jgi:hypothetical protein
MPYVTVMADTVGSLRSVSAGVARCDGPGPGPARAGLPYFTVCHSASGRPQPPQTPRERPWRGVTAHLRSSGRGGSVTVLAQLNDVSMDPRHLPAPGSVVTALQNEWIPWLGLLVYVSKPTDIT